MRCIANSFRRLAIHGERMRRLIYLLLLAVFLGTSLSCISASTDCERWLTTYRLELAHSRQLQRVAAVRRRARAYARRKLAAYLNRTPKLRPAVTPRPRMTRKQTLRHLDLACGVLPEEEETASLVPESPSEFPLDPPSGGLAGLFPSDPGELMAENQVPSSPFGGGTRQAASERGPSAGAPSGGAGGWGGGGFASGSAATTLPPTKIPQSGTPQSGTPQSGPPAPSGKMPPSSPPTGWFSNLPSGPSSAPPSYTLTETPPTPAPPAAVPEPASYVFLITGLAGLAGTIRRRMQA